MNAGPYRVERVNPRDNFWRIVGPTEHRFMFGGKNDADVEAEMLNAAYAAGLAASGREAELRTALSNTASALGETVNCLSFAFEEGAIPKDMVLGLYVDPYGMLADAKTRLAEANALLTPTEDRENPR